MDGWSFHVMVYSEVLVRRVDGIMDELPSPLPLFINLINLPLPPSILSLGGPSGGAE
jgi:hypothetical protein